MLDERGIEWRAVEGVDDTCTAVEIGNTYYTYLEQDFDFETTAQFWCCYTPEQVIDATVGETCHMTLLPDEPTTSIQPMRCTACGHKTYAQLANYCPHCGRRVVDA